jgi:hypothetical protein
MALGFNTLDWMTHVNPPAMWGFCWGLDILVMPFWYAYFLGGILPLWGGGFLVGIIVGIVAILSSQKKKLSATNET